MVYLDTEGMKPAQVREVKQRAIDSGATITSRVGGSQQFDISAKESLYFRDEDKLTAFKAYVDGQFPKKPSSNRKYSLDNSDRLEDNVSRKYSLGEHIRSGHSRVNNKIVLNDTGTAIKSIELGLPIGQNESHDERVTRRLREIEGIDYTLVNKGGNSAFVNLVPDIQKAEIDERIRNGADPAELIQHYKVKFNTMIARYADGLREEKRIGYALLLKGAAYYVAEKTGTTYNRERGGGIFDERPEGVGRGARAEEAGNRQNSIRPESRSEEDGFSNAKKYSLDGKPIVGVRKYSVAWHGTEHDFETFTLDAIGTGSGGQEHYGRS